MKSSEPHLLIPGIVPAIIIVIDCILANVVFFVLKTKEPHILIPDIVPAIIIVATNKILIIMI